jgi:hypothetical protein
MKQKQTQTLSRNDGINSFVAILGILSVLAYPIFHFTWNAKPIEIPQYVGILAIFGVLFLLLMFAFERSELLRAFFVPYINWVMPAFCVLAWLGMGLVISAFVYVIALIALHIAFVLAHTLVKRFSPNTNSFRQVNENILYFLPFGYGMTVWIWVSRAYHLFQAANLKAWIILCLGFPFILFCLWWVDNRYKTLKPAYRGLLYLSVVLLTIGLVYRPELFIDRWHYNYFLAPMHDFVHGRIPYVTTTSQYGIGVIYWLILVFSALRLPIGYEGLSFVVVVLYILQYLWLAFILWQAADDLVSGVIGLLAMIYFNYLTVYWQSILRIPAQSSLRYGLIYVLLGVALLNLKHPRRYLQILEIALVSFASLWSLDTFVYTLVSLDAFYFVSDALSAPKFQEGLKKFAGRLAIQAGVVVLSWAGMCIYIYSATGKLPDLQIYMAYFQSQIDFAPEEVKTLGFQMSLTGAAISIYLFSLFAVLFERRQRERFLSDGAASTLAGMSLAGLVFFVYYLVFFFDFHFALMCIPAIFILAQWAGIIRQSAALPLALKRSLLGMLLISLMIFMVMASSNFYNKFSKSLLYTALVRHDVPLRNPYHVAPSNPSVEVLIEFIQRYAAGQEQIAIFVDSDDQVEALLLTGKIELLGMTEAEMSEISPVYSQYILNNARKMAGSPIYIFYCARKRCLTPLQIEAYRIMTENADYKMVDEKKDIIVLKKAE